MQTTQNSPAYLRDLGVLMISHQDRHSLLGHTDAPDIDLGDNHRDTAGFLYPRVDDPSLARVRVAISPNGYLYAEKCPRTPGDARIFIIARLDLSGENRQDQIRRLTSANTSPMTIQEFAAIAGELNPVPAPAHRDIIAQAWSHLREPQHLTQLEVHHVVCRVATELAEAADVKMEPNSCNAALGRNFTITGHNAIQTPEGPLTHGFVITHSGPDARHPTAVIAARGSHLSPPAVRNPHQPGIIEEWTPERGDQETWLMNKLRTNVANFLKLHGTNQRP